ncbi:MAG: PLP-dependent aminotransferase family protein [Pseudomonadota bacterium]
MPLHTARTRSRTRAPAVSLRLDIGENFANKSAEIARQLRKAISSGILRPGDRIASTRQLASDLGVARGTAFTALELLIAEGLLETRQGSGTFVSPDARSTTVPVASGKNPLPQPKISIIPDVDSDDGSLINCQPCRPSVAEFPVPVWRRCMSFAASARPASNYGDPMGSWDLRESISHYLRRSRAFDADPSQIIVTNGAIHALYLLATAYLDRESAVAMENPGYPLARQVFGLTGAEIVNIPVDEQGMQTSELSKIGENCQLAYVTPSNQFPMGSRLSLQRRCELLEWASENRVLLLEDDYDGEFRYDVAPLPPLASLPHDGHVIYLGTFSKTMYPGLRVGFAVAPKPIIEVIAGLRTITDYQSNTVTQRALAKFIDDGEYEKHVHRMRRTYARRRAVLADLLGNHGNDMVLRGIDSGINALVQLQNGTSAADVAREARGMGVSMAPLTRYDYENENGADHSLVIGYGALESHEIVDVVSALASSSRLAKRNRVRDPN